MRPFTEGLDSRLCTPVDESSAAIPPPLGEVEPGSIG